MSVGVAKLGRWSSAEDERALYDWYGSRSSLLTIFIYRLRIAKWIGLFLPAVGTAVPCRRENVTGGVTVLLLEAVTMTEERCSVCIKMPLATFLSKRKRRTREGHYSALVCARLASDEIPRGIGHPDLSFRFYSADGNQTEKKNARRPLAKSVGRIHHT